LELKLAIEDGLMSAWPSKKQAERIVIGLILLALAAVGIRYFNLATFLQSMPSISSSCPDMSTLQFANGRVYGQMDQFGVSLGSNKRTVFDIMLRNYSDRLYLDSPVVSAKGDYKIHTMSAADWETLKKMDEWEFVWCGSVSKFVVFTFKKGSLTSIRDERRWPVP
jgi:hypothetical protein